MGPEVIAAMTIAGTAFQAIGMVDQAFAARREGQFNERVAENRARAARQRGEADERTRRREQRLRAGMRRANVGASGIDFSGSVQDVFDDEALAAEEDIFNIRRNALLEEQGLLAQADAERARGRAGFTGGILGAGAALTQGAARLGTGTGTDDTSGTTGTTRRSGGRRIPVQRQVIGAN